MKTVSLFWQHHALRRWIRSTFWCIWQLYQNLKKMRVKTSLSK